MMRDSERGMEPQQAYELIATNVQRVIRGKPQVVRLAVATLFAGGHLLIEDLPGLGKTSLARSLARSAVSQNAERHVQDTR